MLDEVQKMQHKSVNKTYLICAYMCMYSSICTSVPAQHMYDAPSYMLDEVQHRSVNKTYSVHLHLTHARPFYILEKPDMMGVSPCGRHVPPSSSRGGS